MTDIVERLRERAAGAWEDIGFTKTWVQCDLAGDAADEIERLKAALSDGVLRDVLWGILTPDDGTAPPPNYTLVQLARDRMSDIERLRARLETVRHEAQAATKLVLEHQSKNCHLHAEIERLREALRAIIAQSEKWSWNPEHGILRTMAREALND